MAKRDELLRVIEKEIETADNYDIAVVYAEIVGCGKCPYWHDCQNMHECSMYIFDKLRGEEEQKRGRRKDPTQ